MLLTGQAQDKVITQNGDTILCRIISISNETIVYEQKIDEKRVTGKHILLREVAEYSRTLTQTQNEIRVSQTPERPYLFSLQSGLSHLFVDLSETREMYIQYYGLTSQETDKYINKIKNGFFINANFHYLTTNYLGIGIDYNFFRSASKGDFITNANYGYGSTDRLPVYLTINSDERTYLNFIAPSVLFMQYLGENKKIRLTESLAPGAIFMRLESRSNDYLPYWGTNSYIIGNPPMYYAQSGSVVTGLNFAAKVSLSLDYCITPNWSAGLTGNFIWANIKKIRQKYRQSEESTTLDESITFSHLNYGLVIRYNF